MPTSSLDQAALQADLHSRLVANSDATYATWISRYMRNETRVLGLRMPAVRTTVAEWAEAHGLADADVEETKMLALRLFELPFAEEKLAGTFLLRNVLQPKGAIGVEDLGKLAELFDRGLIADWGSCDSFSSKVVAFFVKEHGEVAVRGVADWCEAENLWRARASVVGLLGKCKSAEGRRVLIECCKVVVRREERFAKTAVGWGLREIGKRDQGMVRGFVADHLGNLSLESLRNATKHFDKEERDRFVKLLKEGKSR